MTNLTEIWKDIPSYEGYYQASTLGHIRSSDRLIHKKENRRGTLIDVSQPLKGRILKPSLGTHGYLGVGLSKNGKRETHTVHSLISRTFLEKPEGKYEVSHKNGNRLDNRLSNLQWLVRKDHREYDGENHPFYVLDRQTGKEILFRDGRQAGEYFGNSGLRVDDIMTRGGYYRDRRYKLRYVDHEPQKQAELKAEKYLADSKKFKPDTIVLTDLESGIPQFFKSEKELCEFFGCRIKVSRTIERFDGYYKKRWHFDYV